jgi:uncharacterized iron-regulated protein
MPFNDRIKFIITLTSLFILFLLPDIHATNRIRLEVDIDIDRSQINGTEKFHISSGKDVVLMTGALKINDIRLNGTPVSYDEFDGTVKIMAREKGEIVIRYTGIFKDQGVSASAENPYVQNVIDDRGISLTNLWYPTHGALAHYDLRATFPMGYKAISEADNVKMRPRKGKVEYRFHFPYKVDGINLVASDRYEIVGDEFRGIKIYGYFFKEDKELAKTYIKYTKKYLELYEDLVGMYPYKRFSIVENFLPTGYSMPTYTLLGRSVVKLPFIVKTSLGHEILHQWFGNFVYIDYGRGNWAEGLTAYLSDHLYREQEGEGWKYRKQILIDYQSYVDVANDVPLKYFSGRVDRASRAIGYGKAALVFHMLKNMVGEKTFYASLKDLIENNRFKRASWNDIRLSFEKQYGQDLKWFFTQWTEKEGLIELSLYGVELSQTGNEFDLHFHIDQGGNFFKAKLPITIYFRERVLFDILNLDSTENSFNLTLKEKPRRIVLDEDYDIARGLYRDESPPVIAGLLGEDNIIIAVPPGGEVIYERLIDEFEKKGAVSKAADDITISDIEDSAVIILGIDNPLIRRLCGSLAEEDAGFSAVVKDNPWNRKKVMAVFHGRSKKEVDAAFRKIGHYGKYSKLLFNEGVNTGKEIQETKRGMVMDLQHEATAIEVSSIKTLSDVVNGVRDKKIIYVGEVHDVFAHHAVQLDIITGIYKKHPKVAIGMEMFQRPFQETLDTFISGRMGESSFLKESEYFKRWGFDYNLYKPILDFARTEKMPVVALNLQREIIEQVSKKGIDSLSEEEKSKIPQELDFSDKEYRERLEEIFSMHRNSREKNFNNFYQSQILWDETMSQSVYEFLEKNPDHKMVVLAGQGHLAYGSGIPKRVYRRNGFDYGIIVIDEDVERDIADYVVFPKPVEGITTPKLMVFLTPDEGRLKIAGFPDNSVSEKAGLRVDDLILFVDDVEITSIDDVRIYLLYKRKGDFVKVKILREEEGRKEEMVVDVEL